MRPTSPPRARSFAGLTLVELLVALLLLSLTTAMVWRGIDAMVRTLDGLKSRHEEAQAVRAVLAQWRADLDQMNALSGVTSWSWDGKVLRLTRDVPSTNDIQVVAWTWREDVSIPNQGWWMRWQSPPCRSKQAWQRAWRDALQWSRSPTADLTQGEVRLNRLSRWQLSVNRNGAWSHPLSSAGTHGREQPPSIDGDAGAPDAVRLVLELPPDSALAGRLTVDWIHPAFMPDRS